jgi:ABC-type polysaccharide/polyol phosphate transport system ATPase subunit
VAAAIEIDGVTKTFRLYKEKPTSLKERVLRFRRVRYEHFTALKDIRLDIEAGTTVGVLLLLRSRITALCQPPS